MAARSTPTRSAPTREQRAALKALGADTNHLAALTNAGCPAGTAMVLIAARMESTGIPVEILHDAEILRMTGDTQLLTRIVTSRCDIAELDYALRNGDVTASHIAEALDLGIDPNRIAVWTRAGRAIADLAGPLAELPNLDPGTVIQGLLAGMDASDLAWITTSGVLLPARGLSNVVSSILFDAAVNEKDEESLEVMLGQMTRDQRRLSLVLISRLQYNGSAVLALTALLGDVPWLDTLTSLILDWTPVHRAIGMARADHNLEQQRTRIVTAGRASGPVHGR
jgi:hypothetical protein